MDNTGVETNSRIAVLITTRNRRDILERSLDRIFASDQPDGGFEVVVVDDGSTDDTPRYLQSVTPPRGIVFRTASYPPTGASHGLNRAAELATADFMLILGDDSIIPTGLVAAHLSGLRKLADPEVALTGRVRWCGTQPHSRFREWLGRGIIHRHPDLQAPGFGHMRHFFTLNASIHRSMLERSGGFPEDISSWTDTVFAFQAAMCGMKLYYDPSLVVEHHHEWSEEEYSVRQRKNGRIAAGILEEIPSFGNFVEIPRPGLRRNIMSAFSRVAYPVARALHITPLEGWYFAHRMNDSFVRGFREAGGR